MVDEVIEEQTKKTGSRVRNLVGKHQAGDPDQVNLKRQRFLAMLSSQYGYTNEKAVEELERLLKHTGSFSETKKTRKKLMVLRLLS